MSTTVRIVVPQNDFPRIAGGLERHVKDAQRRALLKVVEVADPNTPVDTGFMRSNKTIDDDSVTWNADYSAYQHNGTRYIAPNPFAQMGVDAAAPQFIKDLQTLGFT